VSKIPFFVQKLQILEQLEKWSTFIFVSKLTIFSGKKFEIFEFTRLNWSKNCHFMVLFWALFDQNRDFWPNIGYTIEFKDSRKLNFGTKIQN